MPEVTIDPKHARLQAFLAGKGITNTQEKQTLQVSDTELRSMLRKAKEHGYENLVKYNKADLKKADKAAEEVTESEPKLPEPSDETTADQEVEDEEEKAKPRRRRVP